MPLFPALVAAVFMSTLAMRMTDPLVPILAGEFHVSPGDIALFATAYAIPYGVFQLVLGPLGDRFGKTTVIKASLFLLGLAILASAYAPSYRAMIVIRAFSGCVAGGVIPLSLATISDLVAIERRQLVLSRVLFAAISGQIMGAFVTGLLVGWLPWRGIFIAYAAVCLLIFGALLTTRALPRNPDGASTFLAALSRYRHIAATPTARLLLATVFAEGLLFYGFLGQLPAYLTQMRGGSAAEIGAIVAGYGLGGAVYAVVLPLLFRIVDGYGLMRLCGIVGGLAITLATLPLPGVSYAGLTVLAGFAFYSLHVGLQTRASELDPRARGAAISLISATLFMGNGFGPWVQGESVVLAGYAVTFAGVGALVLALGLLAATAFRRFDIESA